MQPSAIRWTAGQQEPCWGVCIHVYTRVCASVCGSACALDSEYNASVSEKLVNEEKDEAFFPCIHLMQLKYHPVVESYLAELRECCLFMPNGQRWDELCCSDQRYSF